MSAIRVQRAAGHRLDEIHRHTSDVWGEAQADRYVRSLFEHFAAIAAQRVVWPAIPAAFGVDGFVCRYERHFIYWKVLDDGDIGIVTILHERMHQIDRFRDDLG